MWSNQIVVQHVLVLFLMLVTLNDILLVGPKLQSDIIAILLQFRLHVVAITSDIKQMYRQILMHLNHRDYQRVLWRFTASEPIQEFRLNT